MKTKITFLRHAQTDANKDGNFCGSLDLPLNETGKRQAAQAAALLGNTKFDVVLYGRGRRVCETAEAVVAKLRQKPAAILQAEEIREMDFGIFEGLHYREIAKRYPEEWQKYMDDWQIYVFPQGDGVAAYYNTCSRWVDGLIDKYGGKSILVVGHKGFILNCLSALLTHDGGDVLSRDIGNAETVSLEV